jgi:hypothetical protein
VLAPMESSLNIEGIAELELPRGLGWFGGERVIGIIGVVLDETGSAHGLGEGREVVDWTCRLSQMDEPLFIVALC